MKKLFFISFVILIFTSGCYDYTELNNMAIVSGIGVDYEENNFKVTFEILNTVNKDDNPDAAKVYTTEGFGTSLSSAFSAASLEIAKLPYMAHLKTIIISEEVAKNHVKEMIDFLLRDNHIRNIFYLAISKNISANEIIKHTDDNNPIASNAIAKLIDTNLFSNNIAADLNYEEFVTNIIDNRKDTYASSIILENNVLKLGPLAIFRGYEMQTFLTEDESATFNVLNGDSNEIHFKVNCPNDDANYIVLTTFNTPKTSISIENNDVLIKTEVEIRVVENHCKIDFKDVNTYTKIQDKVKEKIISDIEEVVKKAKMFDSDILKIKQTYYQKYKKEVDFKLLNYKYDAKAIINRNGLIFEVENDK